MTTALASNAGPQAIAPSRQKTPTQQLSLPSSSRTTITTLARLCSMKNQAQFTPHKAETWAATLSIYPVREVNRAILSFGLSTDPFPDLCKIVLECERIRREREGTMPQGELKVSAKVVSQIASALKIEV